MQSGAAIGRCHPSPTHGIGRSSHSGDLGWVSEGTGTAARAHESRAGLNPSEWTPRELRHSFVSLLSDAGVPLEQISQLVGHSGTTVTELVYRHQLRPVIQTGAIVMDQLFSGNRRQAD